LQGRAIAPVNLFVDTSVWSLAFRRDPPEERPEVDFLAHGLTMLTTDADFGRIARHHPLALWRG
jgi:hypothetical protein